MSGGGRVPGPGRWSPALVLCAVLLAPVLLRILILACTRSILISDSPYYLILARRAMGGDPLDPEGARTPAYPIFLAQFGADPEPARTAQVVIGALITAMLFVMAWRATRTVWVAAGTALGYGLNVSQARLESSIVTETLTTAFIILSMLAMVCMASSGRNRAAGLWLLVAGCASALAGFTRPLFIFLPVLVLVAADRMRPGLGRGWQVASILPAVLLIGGLLVANWTRLGYPGPTTLAGYNLMNHTGAFVEDAPDRFAVVRDIFLAERRNAVDQGRTHVMAIWGAIPAMRQATGMSYAELSRHLSQMSFGLIAKHPWLYGRSVAVSWTYFWATQGTGSWSRADDTPVERALIGIWRGERLLFVALNGAFLLCVLGMVTRGRWGFPGLGPAGTLTASVVLVASAAQALMERGDNSRYAMPVQPLVMFVVLLGAWILLRRPRPTLTP